MNLSGVLVQSLKASVDSLQMPPSPIRRSNRIRQRGTLYIESPFYPKMSEATLFHQKEDQRKVWITILCSSWRGFLLEKTTSFQLGKKFPPFNGTRRFIITLTSTCHPPPWNWDRSRGQQKSDIYSWSKVPATVLRGKYILLIKTGVMKVANHLVTCVTAGISQKKTTALCVDFPCSSCAYYCFSFMGCIYLGFPSLCEVIIFIFVVELQFLLYVWRKLQRFVVTDFTLYMHVLMCFLRVRKILHSTGVFGSVTTLFIPFWKLKFLPYMLNVTHCFVMYIISYANVYFVAYVCKNCVVCSSKWTIDTDVTP
jgi:hypothetical protein